MSVRIGEDAWSRSFPPGARNTQAQPADRDMGKDPAGSGEEKRPALLPCDRFFTGEAAVLPSDAITQLKTCAANE